MARTSGDVWFVYVARCSDGTFYTGIARDVARRLAEHDQGRRGARYTRGRGPLCLHAVRRCLSQGDALRLERAVKRLDRSSKEGLARPASFRRLARTLEGPVRATSDVDDRARAR